MAETEMEMDGPLFVDEEYRHGKSKHYDLSGPLLFVDPSWNEKDKCSSDDELKCLSSIEKKCLSYINEAVLLENTTAFVKLINNLPFDFLNREFGSIERSMSLWDGGKCAAAVFDGETKLSTTPAWTAWASQVNNGPLHEAADSGNFKMATVLLQRGFSADVRADYDKFKAVLPLDVNLSQIRYFTSAPTGTKAVKLVLQLCGEEMHMPRMLETLRVIALNTRDIKRVFFNYLKNGMMVEVAALLLVARSQVFSLSRSEGEFRSISEMRDFVLNEKRQLPITAIDKFSDMEETLLLLEIFVKIGNKLAELLRVDLRAFPIGSRRCLTVIAENLMQAAGFDVKPKLTSNEVKEAGLRGLGDKSSSTSWLPLRRIVRKTPPYTLRTVRALSTVSVSPLSSPGTVPLPPLSSPGSVDSVQLPPLSSTGSVPMPVTKELVQHLVKNRASILGTMRRVSRFG